METRESRKGEAGEATLDRKIAEALIRDIVAWRIPPGAWLREREIAERFACSHAPVREAFRDLNRDGFVEVVPWRGARILELDHHAVMDVFDAWRFMFGGVCALTARNFDPEDAPHLLSLHEALRTAVERDAPIQEQIRIAWRIGVFISDRCSNRLAQDMLLRVARIARWQHRLFDHVGLLDLDPEYGPRAAVKLYRKVVDAIVARNPNAAEAAARAYLEHSQINIGKVLEALAAIKKQQGPSRKSPRKRSSVTARRERTD